jgi:probable F420-dependent oxidoreductase
VTALEGTGVWSSALRYGDRAEAADAAAELESLGYSTMWVPDVGGDVFAAVANLLAATSSATIATGILNLWMHSAEETAERHHAFTDSQGDRFLLGVGVSHQLLIDLAEEGRYRRPLARTAEFLDGLDAAPYPVPRDRRVLAALGPKMLELARERAGGTHPYLVTPELTERARRGVGADR